MDEKAPIQENKSNTPRTEPNVFDNNENKKNSLANLRQINEDQETSSKPTVEQEKKINEALVNKYRLDSERDAVMFIGVLCQLGGTASECDGNFSYSIKGKTVKLSEVKTIFKWSKERHTEINMHAQMLTLFTKSALP